MRIAYRMVSPSWRFSSVVWKDFFSEVSLVVLSSSNLSSYSEYNSLAVVWTQLVGTTPV